MGNSVNIIYVLIYSFKTNDTHSYESPSFVNLFEGNLQYILALKVSLLNSFKVFYYFILGT